MLNITNYLRNANQNQSEIHLTALRVTVINKNMNVGEDMF